MRGTIASKARGYTATGAIASALAALAAADASLSASLSTLTNELGGKLNQIGGNSIYGLQSFLDSNDTTRASINASTGVFTGVGSGLTSLPAGNLTGSIADSRLSANVALLTGTQTFSGAKTFSATMSFGASGDVEVARAANGQLNIGSSTTANIAQIGSSGNDLYARFSHASTPSNVGLVIQNNGYFYCGASSGTGIDFLVGGTTYMRVVAAGRLLSGTTSDDGINQAQFNGGLSTQGTVPVSASATGAAGSVRWDSSYIYICTASNTWKRVAIATW